MTEKDARIIEGYKDLESGLTKNELQRAITRKGDEVLQSELAITVGAQFKIYEYLLSCLEASQDSSSKQPIKFPKIENNDLRERLEHTVVLFGAKRVYAATTRQYDISLRSVVRRYLEDILPEIPLAEVKSILYENPRGPGGKLGFKYKKITDAKLRDKFKEIVDRYGAHVVVEEGRPLMNFIISQKLQMVMNDHNSVLQSLKSYAAVSADLKSREKKRSQGRDS